MAIPVVDAVINGSKGQPSRMMTRSAAQSVTSSIRTLSLVGRSMRYERSI
jgi:hypothetical protein